MPGAPFVYYGDEIGMRYVEGLTSVEGGFDRTGSRSPMQWDDSINAGFSCASAEKLYIAQDPAADRPNVKAQMADSSSQYHQVKTLLALRQAHSALHNRSDMRFVCDGAPGQALAYERLCEDEKLMVVINPNGKSASFDYAGTLGQPVYTVGGTAVQENGRIIAAPVSAGIYKI